MIHDYYYVYSKVTESSLLLRLLKSWTTYVHTYRSPFEVQNSITTLDFAFWKSITQFGQHSLCSIELNTTSWLSGNKASIGTYWCSVHTFVYKELHGKLITLCSPKVENTVGIRLATVFSEISPRPPNRTPYLPFLSLSSPNNYHPKFIGDIWGKFGNLLARRGTKANKLEMGRFSLLFVCVVLVVMMLSESEGRPKPKSIKKKKKSEAQQTSCCDEQIKLKRNVCKCSAVYEYEYVLCTYIFRYWKVRKKH